MEQTLKELRQTLRNLLRMMLRENLASLADKEMWSFDLEGKLLCTEKNITLLEAIAQHRKEAIELLGGEPAARIFFDRQASCVCSQEKPAIEARLRAFHKIRPPAHTPFAVVRQEPVGHGCFHTGALGTSRPVFRWVYDCGSWTRKAALEKQIEDLEQRCRPDDARETDIDILFISHLHADHISGLGKLLGLAGEPRLRVHTAVVPYVSPAIGFAILISAAARGRCNSDLTNAILDPAKYCADRGVHQLIIVFPRSGAPSAEGTGPTSPPNLLRRRPTLHTTENELSLEFVRPDGSALPTRPEDRIQVGEATPGTVCGIVANGNVWADWWFVPHAHEWVSNEQKLRQTAKELIGLYPEEDGFNGRLAERLRTPAELRDAFPLLRENGASLSLYLGPPPGFDERILYGSPTGRKVGWLLTGDAPLGGELQFEPWKESFDMIANEVGQLMLPHHGAAKNFNPELLTFVPSRARLFATANAVDYDNGKRPPHEVRKEVGRKRLRVVSELTRTLKECSGAPELVEDYLDQIKGW
jgi:hypothetical protein